MVRTVRWLRKYYIGREGNGPIYRVAVPVSLTNKFSFFPLLPHHHFGPALGFERKVVIVSIKKKITESRLHFIPFKTDTGSAADNEGLSQ
ncbi:hypothetical protein LXL04_039092 [Taraxacum kok-saghyz]